MFNKQNTLMAWKLVHFKSRLVGLVQQAGNGNDY